jgi:hypothetical protein
MRGRKTAPRSVLPAINKLQDVSATLTSVTFIQQPVRKIHARSILVPLVASLLILAVRGVEPVTDSAGGPPPAGVTLHLPAWYVVLSPLSRLLDALSILSTAQSIAVFVSVAALAAVFTLARQSSGRRSAPARVAIALAVTIIALAAIEAAVVFAPRPMAQLRSSDPDVMIVDFHSHTGASHDVRKSFTHEDNRDWHRGAGFHVGYISDHVKFDGAVAARAGNPARAGDGTSLLTAVEGRYHRIMSTIVFGLTERDTALLNKRGNVLSHATASGRPPVSIIALPNRNLDSVTAGILDSLENFRAIELVDAAPRGLAQLDREEEKVREIASRLGLVLVAASNNHGWGRTAAAWNLVRVPGWRALPPEEAGLKIEDRLRAADSSSISIVRRLRPSVHGPEVVATLPIVLYQSVATLTGAERLVWILWLWSLALVPLARRSRGRP